MKTLLIIAGIVITLTTSIILGATVQNSVKSPIYYSLDDFVTVENMDILRKKVESLGPNDTFILELHSPGGNMMAANRVYAAIENSPAHIIARVGGAAYSAAAGFLCYADEVQISDVSMILFHLASVGDTKINVLAETDDESAAVYKMNIYELKNQCRKFLNEALIQRIIQGEDIFLVGYEVNQNIANYKVKQFEEKNKNIVGLSQVKPIINVDWVHGAINPSRAIIQLNSLIGGHKYV